jgi:exonuclease SbcD
VLHGALSEYKSKDLVDAESMSVSNLPRGFAYYAGGHIHEKLLTSEHGYNVAYPGTLFGTDFTDLERSAKGQERGFFLVDFSDKVESVEFVPISVCGYDLREHNANGKNSVTVQNDLSTIVQSIEPEGKIILLKVAGEMSGGKTSDVDFQQFKRLLKERGALEVLPNYHRLSSKEYTPFEVTGEDIHEIEERLFKENIGTVKVSDPKLKGEPGIKLSQDVLRVLEQGRPENEGKTSYEGRITSETIEALGIKEDFR